MNNLRSPRPWIALAIVAAAYFASDPFEDFVYPLFAHALSLPKSHYATLALVPYGVRMVVRLIWGVLVWLAVSMALGKSPWAFPVNDRQAVKRSLGGLSVGLIVMLLAMLAICAAGSATVRLAVQSPAEACMHGIGWLVFDFLGAAGEELYGRGIILVVAQRLFGWRAAILVSGLMFSVIHLDNPGASNFWLFRLFVQGMLLAYATFRTGSLWWSVGYHTGWNWISAPLFGAAGSGYLDEGHILEFLPAGPVWITGGAVGPEGSIFAFLAVALAFTILVSTTKRQTPLEQPRFS